MAFYCCYCSEDIKEGSYLEISNHIYVHKEHFMCKKCDTPLQGKKLFSVDGNIYCHQCSHKGEGYDYCARCNDIISDVMIKFDGKKFHKNHFCCSACNKVLELRDKIFKSGKHILCTDCARNDNKCCYNCKAKLSEKFLLAGNYSFHFKCFTCLACNKNIAKSKYKLHNDQFYHLECYKELYDPFCEYCSEQIHDSQHMQDNNGFVFHSECFDNWKELTNPIEEYLNQIATYI